MNEFTPDTDLTSQREPAAIPFRIVDDAAELLSRLFRDFQGAMTLRLWDGTSLRWEADPAADVAAPRYTLVFNNPDAVWALVRGKDPLRLADGYFRGDIDIEGDLFAALGLSEYLKTAQLSFAERVGALLTTLRVRALNRTEPVLRAKRRLETRAQLEIPSETPNDFHALWLDLGMVYSCAYFEQPGADLNRAQVAKLDHICRKLQLKPGDQFLDINCGCGALVEHAATHYGVQAHGVTRSEQQLQKAQQRIAAAGLEDRVTLELSDVLALEGDGRFDKAASVGLLEHIGHGNTPAQFFSLNRLLKPQGLLLNHAITLERGRDARTPFGDFVKRHVFPSGQPDTVSTMHSVMEHASFEIADVEALRTHCSLTFKHWEEQLKQQHERALQFVSESRYRMCRVYMAACAVEFESGSHGVYQVLASKRGAGSSALPLTRHYQYAAASAE